ncbi:hypothetical protein SOHN41_00016 [Shewanella sp. HN-41]|nr:hypothetical protein SOHN41_00016 [Shewanella sp. HN-41]
MILPYIDHCLQIINSQKSLDIPLEPSTEVMNVSGWLG